MNTLPAVLELVAKLAVTEKTLLRKHGIRLRVDKISADGINALCSAAQVQRRFLRSDHTQEAIVEHCQLALSPVYQVGLSPLIRAYPHIKGALFEPIDAKDPFGLRSALHTKSLSAPHTAVTSSPPNIIRVVANGE
jgi:hypothetical protein